jgi:hypothetical protein
MWLSSTRRRAASWCAGAEFLKGASVVIYYRHIETLGSCYLMWFGFWTAAGEPAVGGRHGAQVRGRAQLGALHRVRLQLHRHGAGLPPRGAVELPPRSPP